MSNKEKSTNIKIIRTLSNDIIIGNINDETDSILTLEKGIKIQPVIVGKSEETGHQIINFEFLPLNMFGDIRDDSKINKKTISISYPPSISTLRKYLLATDELIEDIIDEESSEMMEMPETTLNDIVIPLDTSSIH